MDCTVEGCTRVYRGHGFCRTHYSRWRKYGDPQANIPVRDGTASNIGYKGAHDRVKALRGRASNYVCAFPRCDATASDWAYDGLDEDEKRGLDHGKVLAYSTNPDHYFPLCKTHHIRFDAPTRCIRGHEMTEANSMPRGDGWRRCRKCEYDRQRTARQRSKEMSS